MSRGLPVTGNDELVENAEIGDRCQDSQNEQCEPGDKRGLTKRNILTDGPSDWRVRLMVCWRGWQHDMSDGLNAG